MNAPSSPSVPNALESALGTALKYAPDSALDNMPHRPPMRLLSRLVADASAGERGEATIDAYEAEAVITAHNPFLVADVVERVALVEMLAQAFAAGSALHTEGAPQVGYLVGLRDVRFYGDAYVGDTLRIRVRLETSLVPFFMIRGEVVKRHADASESLLAEGQIRLFLPALSELPELAEQGAGS